MKPLFIPLKKQHYLKFLDGSKTVEYRKAGIGSRWNRRVCEIGRPVVLSNGYGKSGRINGIITGFKESRRSGTRREFEEIYGPGHVAACISIQLI